MAVEWDVRADLRARLVVSSSQEAPDNRSEGKAGQAGEDPGQAGYRISE